MSVNDLFLLIVLWAHLVSATAWVGGSIFYLFVRAMVDTAIFVLLATGIILTFNRLTPGVIGVQYALVLAVKIALSVWMFILARDRRRRTALSELHRERPTPPSGPLRNVLRALSGYNTLVILGLVVFLLADALDVIFESALNSQ